MKNIRSQSCLIILFFFLANYPLLAQNKSNVTKIDSLFEKNLKELTVYCNCQSQQNHLSSKNINCSLTSENMKFMGLISYLSGIDRMIVNYSGYEPLTFPIVKEWTKWYYSYREKIDWEKHILKGYELMAKQNIFLSEEEYFAIENQLRDLKIK